MRGPAENILRRFAEIVAAFGKPIGYFSPPRLPASDVATETRGESATAQAGADATATENVVAAPAATATFSASVTTCATINQRRSLIG